jgi:hypothetical protein
MPPLRRGQSLSRLLDFPFVAPFSVAGGALESERSALGALRSRAPPRSAGGLDREVSGRDADRDASGRGAGRLSRGDSTRGAGRVSRGTFARGMGRDSRGGSTRGIGRDSGRGWTRGIGAGDSRLTLGRKDSMRLEVGAAFFSPRGDSPFPRSAGGVGRGGSGRGVGALARGVSRGDSGRGVGALARGVSRGVSCRGVEALPRGASGCLPGGAFCPPSRAPGKSRGPASGWPARGGALLGLG